MHSRILDEAMELGLVVSNAAGNSGEDNDGLSGMSDHRYLSPLQPLMIRTL